VDGERLEGIGIRADSGHLDRSTGLIEHMHVEPPAGKI
jgi:hypothetical protein